jgi:hypothetical protein
MLVKGFMLVKIISFFFLFSDVVIAKKSFSLQRQEASDVNAERGRFYLTWIYIFLFIPPLILTIRELWLDPTTPVLIAILWKRIKELVSYSPVNESDAEGDEFVERLLAESKLRRRKIIEKEEAAAIAKAEANENEENEGKSSLREKYFTRSGFLNFLRQRSKSTTAEAETVAHEARQASERRTRILPT